MLTTCSGQEDGSGAAVAIQRALAQADLRPQDVNHITAHATSTPVGDQAEVSALRRVFADSLKHIPVSATNPPQ